MVGEVFIIMKKFFLFLISIVLIPCAMTLLFGLFNDEIQIGKNGNSLKNKQLGKNVLIEINGLYKSIDVEEFVLGILPGTIPADYDDETLKVQAVLIRTNVLKEMLEKNTGDAADLSYRYLTVEERIALWGERNYEKQEGRFEKAVAQTAGQVIEQENSLIMALYHEVSIGKTASAKEILGEDISYLQSVGSSQDVEAKHYMNIVSYTWQELQKRNSGEIKKESGEEIKEEAENKTDDNAQIQSASVTVSINESTENGFVKQLLVDGTAYTGDEAMNCFELTSTNFYVEEIEGGIRFICLGKGNCLGVSLYGANRMALEGKSMEEIIKYYYKGVSVVNYST